ncbi:MAG: hypothetical protein KDB00_11175 [Planctomycetales bacterium]|nr:hypothetical protein [Planctomycetales bacterium]
MDADKLKDFALYNFEKLIVGIVVLMSAYLVHSGLGQTVITKVHDPKKLELNANDVKQRVVDEDHTEAIVNAPDKSREPVHNIAQELQKFRNPIRSDLYAQTAWDKTKSSSEKVRRQDPVLGKPAGIQATGVIASLAWRSKDGLYAISELEPADELEKVEVKPKRTKKSKKADMMEMMMGGGDDMSGMDAEYEMEMMMMQNPMASASTTASGPVRKLAPEKNLGTTAKATQSLELGEDQPPVPGLGLFIAGTAVIPHKELINSYQKALSYAAEYEPRVRDRPRYVAYEVQRADVTTKSVDQLTDADWVVRDSNEITIWNAANYWSGFAPEIVPTDYWMDGVTMWIPPVLLDPYASFATNPLIPMKTQRELEAERAELEAEAEKASTGPADRDKYTVDIGGGNTRARGRGGMDMMDMEMGMDEAYDMEMGMGMGMGMGGQSAMEGQPAEENPVDYKLIRFYDFYYIKGKTFKVGGRATPLDPNAPKLNHKYVYRVRFAVNDPNFPQKPELQPQGSSLDPEAYKRYIALSASAEQNQQRDFKRWSEWSEPSAPTSLPSLDQAEFGSVKPHRPRVVTSGPRRIVLELEPPKAEVVAESFDPKLGVFVPTRMEATEGTVLSQKVESAEVVDPITLEVKKTGETTIVSSATVIDIEGGAPLEIVEDDEAVVEPGFFLMMDGEGKLKVKDATEQQRLYRIKSFAEERGL